MKFWCAWLLISRRKVSCTGPIESYEMRKPPLRVEYLNISFNLPFERTGEDNRKRVRRGRAHQPSVLFLQGMLGILEACTSGDTQVSPPSPMLHHTFTASSGIPRLGSIQ